MKTYARVDNGIVQEVIEPFADPDGNEYAIEDRFTPDLVAQMVDITGIAPKPQLLWTYDGVVFAAAVPDLPTLEEIAIANERERQALLFVASNAMAPILVSLQLGDATDNETVKAKAWQEYYRALKLIDINAISPDWPTAPE